MRCCVAYYPPVLCTRFFGRIDSVCTGRAAICATVAYVLAGVASRLLQVLLAPSAIGIPRAFAIAPLGALLAELAVRDSTAMPLATVSLAK